MNESNDINNIKIWVDADSCPSQVKTKILKEAKKNHLAVIYVANRNIPFSIESPLFSMVICEKAKDAADDYIVENSSGNDLVVTRDIPLAKRLVDKKIHVINDRGTKFDTATIKYMLEERELCLQMIALKVHSSNRARTWSDKEFLKFSECLDSVLAELLSGHGGIN